MLAEVRFAFFVVTINAALVPQKNY